MSETKHTPLPCGLCGSPARVSRRSGVTGTACKSRYYREAVVCTGCGVTTKEVKVPGVAVERWNARVARIDALEPVTRECLGWIRHWQADVAGNLKPTPDSLAMMEAKLVAILEAKP